MQDFRNCRVWSSILVQGVIMHYSYASPHTETVQEHRIILITCKYSHHYCHRYDFLHRNRCFAKQTFSSQDLAVQSENASDAFWCIHVPV